MNMLVKKQYILHKMDIPQNVAKHNHQKVQHFIEINLPHFYPGYHDSVQFGYILHSHFLYVIIPTINSLTSSKDYYLPAFYYLLHFDIKNSFIIQYSTGYETIDVKDNAISDITWSAQLSPESSELPVLIFDSEIQLSRLERNMSRINMAIQNRTRWIIPKILLYSCMILLLIYFFLGNYSNSQKKYVQSLKNELNLLKQTNQLLRNKIQQENQISEKAETYDKLMRHHPYHTLSILHTLNIHQKSKTRFLVFKQQKKTFTIEGYSTIPLDFYDSLLKYEYFKNKKFSSDTRNSSDIDGDKFIISGELDNERSQ